MGCAASPATVMRLEDVPMPGMRHLTTMHVT